MKKFAFLLPVINVGGTEVNAYKMCSSKSMKSFNKFILFNTVKSESMFQSLSMNANMVKLNNSISKTLFLHLYIFLKAERPDFISTSSFSCLIQLFLAKLLTFSSAKIIFKFETDYEKYLKDKNLYLNFFFFKLLGSMLFRKTHYLIFCTDSYREKMSRYFGLSKKMTTYVLPNPIVDVKDFEVSPIPSHPFFNKLGKKTVIISIGRLVESKGFGDLIDAFEVLISENKNDYFLLIIGEGKLKESLEEKIKERKLSTYVSIIDFREDFLAYIEHSDLYVSNSMYEGLNNNLIHALSKGKKIISTDCAFGPSEILENGKYGELIPVGDKPALIKSILRYRQGDHKNHEKLKTKARSYEIEKATKSFVNIILDQS